jgi:integrase
LRRERPELEAQVRPLELSQPDHQLRLSGDRRLPLDAIEVEHIRAVIKAASGVPALARRVRQRIEAILDNATAKGQRSATARNPAEAKFHPAAKRRHGDRPHYRRVALDDAPAAFRQLRQLAASSTALSAWAFMIATAVRPSEALKARWDEINPVKKLRTIPASRMKNNREHAAPLSSVALAVLERQAKVRVSDAVFPGLDGAPLNYTSFYLATAKAGVEAGTASPS